MQAIKDNLLLVIACLLASIATGQAQPANEGWEWSNSKGEEVFSTYFPADKAGCYVHLDLAKNTLSIHASASEKYTDGGETYSYSEGAEYVITNKGTELVNSNISAGMYKRNGPMLMLGDDFNKRLIHPFCDQRMSLLPAYVRKVLPEEWKYLAPTKEELLTEAVANATSSRYSFLSQPDSEKALEQFNRWVTSDGPLAKETLATGQRAVEGRFAAKLSAFSATVKKIELDGDTATVIREENFLLLWMAGETIVTSRGDKQNLHTYKVLFRNGRWLVAEDRSNSQ